MGPAWSRSPNEALSENTEREKGITDTILCHVLRSQNSQGSAWVLTKALISLYWSTLCTTFPPPAPLHLFVFSVSPCMLAVPSENSRSVCKGVPFVFFLVLETLWGKNSAPGNCLLDQWTQVLIHQVWNIEWLIWCWLMSWLKCIQIR